jgi:demethylmenaquinone methyltransferase/2-methoxy-6-polyprenyl-1,4-benzoquinol methylase
MTGTTPAGTSSEEQAARWVRGMFSRIAPRYDLLNHVLSFNRDRAWRRSTVRSLEPLRGVRVLDLCCGTGDLALELARAGAEVWTSDFAHPMLLAAGEKGCARRIEADALRLPLPDQTFDAVTVAFGFRNFANYRAGLAEMRRVLRTGGRLAILEFSTPPNALMRAAYGFYSRHILPRIGGVLSGAPDAYTYLPESVRKFPGAEELARQMEQAGYAQVRFQRMTAGVVALHTGTRVL